MSLYAPIALFVYNRPSHLKEVITSLKNNIYAKESDLYIFSDAAKNKKDVALVEGVRGYIESISGFKSLRIVKRDTNKGLSESIITGVNEILDKHGSIIVLEDDHITSPYFLKYMNDGLNLYEYEEDVISIHAYIYPLKQKLPQTFFIRGADCWGWATWKDRWQLFEPDGAKLLKEINSSNLEAYFNFDNNYNYTKMLRDQIAGKNDSWAIRWHASAFLNNKLTLFPSKSLVKNIGNDGSGIHAKNTNLFSGELSLNRVEVKRIPVKQNEIARQEICKYLKSNKSIYKKVIDKILMC